MASADADPEIRKAARERAKRKYTTHMKVKKQLTIKRKLKLRKRHYKGWKKMWENMESDEASAEFAEDLDKQGYEMTAI